MDGIAYPQPSSISPAVPSAAVRGIGVPVELNLLDGVFDASHSRNKRSNTSALNAGEQVRDSVLLTAVGPRGNFFCVLFPIRSSL
jgi:hypothetical protein